MALVILLLLLALALPVGASDTVRCITYHETTLNRWHALCDDGMRGISRWSSALRRWESTITPPAREHRETWRPHPKGGPWGRGR